MDYSDEPGFRQPDYLRNERGRQMSSYQLLSVLGLKPRHPIPKDFSLRATWVGNTMVYIKPANLYSKGARRIECSPSAPIAALTCQRGACICTGSMATAKRAAPLHRTCVQPAKC